MYLRSWYLAFLLSAVVEVIHINKYIYLPITVQETDRRVNERQTNGQLVKEREPTNCVLLVVVPLIK